MDSELDSSWIEEEESRYNSVKDRENMDSIRCFFIYVGAGSTILKIIKDDEELSDIGLDDSTIDVNKKKGIQNNRLLHIIQNKRLLEGGQRFKISSLVKYVVDIEPEFLSGFLGLDDSGLRDSGFLKEVNIFGDVIIEPSIFCFHSIASLYFFFREDEMFMKPVRSILKVHNNKGNNGRATKKVRIFEDINVNMNITENDPNSFSSNNGRATKKVRD